MADLNSLLIFGKVVEANSFSEAARRLRMPLSTVSRRIADLESQLGVRLLERSTRSLRLTEIGNEILEHALHSAEISGRVDDSVSYQWSNVAGNLRLCAPPSISDALLAPLLSAFQAHYPDVRLHTHITDRTVEGNDDAFDVAFTIGPMKDSSMVAQRLLTFRQQLVASPAYLERCEPPNAPKELAAHRLLSCSISRRANSWAFVHVNGRDTETVSFQPHLSVNDFGCLVPALLAGAGIGDLSPLVRPDALREGRLVEVLPDWRFPARDLSLVHHGRRHAARQVRVFMEFAQQLAPTLFPGLVSRGD